MLKRLKIYGMLLAMVALVVLGGSDNIRAVEAAALRISGMNWNGKTSDLLDPAHAAWKSAKPVAVLLNHTPRIYRTDKADQASAPEAWLRCARVSNNTIFHLTWRDATKDQPAVRKASPAGKGAGVRVAHSQMTNRYYDSAAVMVPVDRKPKANPCIQMGEKGAPVDIYFWQSVKGPALMKGSGRAATERTGKSFPSKAVYADGQWRVCFVLPELPDGTPVAIAIWNGSKGQRGGLKYYSLWHSLR